MANHPIKTMAAAGIKLMLDCDDPPMFKTDPTRDMVLAHEHMGFTVADFRRFMLNGVDGCWVDDATKTQWKAEMSAEFDALSARLA
jgi:adenine deaminase